MRKILIRRLIGVSALVAASAVAAPAIAAPVACFDGGLDPCQVANTAGTARIALNSDPQDRDELAVWEVNGIDQLAEFEWFFSQGTTTTDLGTFTFNGATADDVTNILRVEYSNAVFSAALEYQLSEAGDALTQALEVTNDSAVTQDFTLFAYLDLQINGTPDNDTATFNEATGLLRQSDADSLFEGTWQSLVAFDGWELRDDTIDSALRDGVINATTGLANQFPSFGPADIGFAYQFDFTVAPGETVGLSFENSVAEVPLPAPALLLLSGIGGLVLLRRRRRAA